MHIKSIIFNFNLNVHGRSTTGNNNRELKDCWCIEKNDPFITHQPYEQEQK